MMTANQDMPSDRADAERQDTVAHPDTVALRAQIAACSHQQVPASSWDTIVALSSRHARYLNGSLLVAGNRVVPLDEIPQGIPLSIRVLGVHQRALIVSYEQADAAEVVLDERAVR